MASLQAKHVGKCASGKAWTPFASAKDGCTCPQGPVYYVVVRAGSRAEKVRVGRDRQAAERALRKIAVEVDDGSYLPQQKIAFADWGRRWLAGLERKRTTVDSYRSTIAYASELFGQKRVRRIGPQEIASFNARLRERGVSPSTRAKHLRVLGG
ncbi:MAG: hypothetical protein HY511_02040, partial [Actinobacteria bacterium]|nr:hypothetical protein [Actinomycetota bacterium]